jgi:NAD(P)-dependent dehydrogenase (short-subunit alcohol dehydrogenase family)
VKDFQGKCAVITGAGGGIGLGSAKVFAKAGMNVALLDSDGAKLKAAVAEVKVLGGKVFGWETDVSDHDSVECAAGHVEREFGKIHLLFNNAGIVLRGLKMEEIDDKTWDWVLGVNLYGVIHGIQSFVPRIRAHREGGHVVNTASMAGLFVGTRQTGAYATSKFGVVALSEALSFDVKEAGIGVSVLCPAAVNTNIYPNSAGVRGNRMGNHEYDSTPSDIAAGMDPEEVGRRVKHAIKNGIFYIVTHPATRDWVTERHARLLRDYDAMESYEKAAG